MVLILDIFIIGPYPNKPPNSSISSSFLPIAGITLTAVVFELIIPIAASSAIKAEITSSLVSPGTTIISNPTEQTAVIGKAVTIQTVLNGVVYYTDSTGGKIYAINLDGTNNEKVVFEAKFNTSWLNLELNADGDKLMLAFFNSDDYNYVHVVNILADEDSTMIGIINDADKEAIEKAEEAAK